MGVASNQARRVYFLFHFPASKIIYLASILKKLVWFLEEYHQNYWSDFLLAVKKSSD
ncbi:hypothetical protein D922_02505 [Enterococcus faecalis 06-MB-DW-09]|nr:hypothetical protein D922_02505 [Enterococcus faecalis 06-MB-DW-09]